jgi:hypothetical protein
MLERHCDRCGVYGVIGPGESTSTDQAAKPKKATRRQLDTRLATLQHRLGALCSGECGWSCCPLPSEHARRRGEAAFRASDNPDARVLARVGAGQCVGEPGVLRDQPRNATAIAPGPVSTLRVEAQTFRRWPARRSWPTLGQGGGEQLEVLRQRLGEQANGRWPRPGAWGPSIRMDRYWRPKQRRRRRMWSCGALLLRRG